MGSRKEIAYQKKVWKRLEQMFPGIFIIRGPIDQYQGICDLIFLWRDKWGALEVKDHKGADEQPNQAGYVALLNGMSFASFIFPENEEEVLNALQQAFGVVGATRISKC